MLEALYYCKESWLGEPGTKFKINIGKSRPGLLIVVGHWYSTFRVAP